MLFFSRKSTNATGKVQPAAEAAPPQSNFTRRDFLRILLSTPAVQAFEPLADALPAAVVKSAPLFSSALIRAASAGIEAVGLRVRPMSNFRLAIGLNKSRFETSTLIEKLLQPQATQVLSAEVSEQLSFDIARIFTPFVYGTESYLPSNQEITAAHELLAAVQLKTFTRHKIIHLELGDEEQNARYAAKFFEVAEANPDQLQQWQQFVQHKNRFVAELVTQPEVEQWFKQQLLPSFNGRLLDTEESRTKWVGGFLDSWLKNIADYADCRVQLQKLMALRYATGASIDAVGFVQKFLNGGQSWQALASDPAFLLRAKFLELSRVRRFVDMPVILRINPPLFDISIEAQQIDLMLQDTAAGLAKLGISIPERYRDQLDQICKASKPEQQSQTNQPGCPGLPVLASMESWLNVQAKSGALRLAKLPGRVAIIQKGVELALSPAREDLSARALVDLKRTVLIGIDFTTSEIKTLLIRAAK